MLSDVLYLQWTLDGDDTVGRLKGFIAGVAQRLFCSHTIIVQARFLTPTVRCVGAVCLADRIGIPPQAQQLITGAQATSGAKANLSILHDGETLEQAGLGGGRALWLVRA